MFISLLLNAGGLVNEPAVLAVQQRHGLPALSLTFLRGSLCIVVRSTLLLDHVEDLLDARLSVLAFRLGAGVVALLAIEGHLEAGYLGNIQQVVREPDFVVVTVLQALREALVSLHLEELAQLVRTSQRQNALLFDVGPEASPHGVVASGLLCQREDFYGLHHIERLLIGVELNFARALIRNVLAEVLRIR